MEIKIDKLKWSISSQKSSGGHYDEDAQYYENIVYRCYKCSCSCVFTAEEQKEAYEVTQKFVWWIPTGCSKCQNDLNVLLAKNHEYQELWNSDKESVKQDKPLMQDWIHAIKDIETYGKKYNQSMITCLVKCINET